MRLAPQPFCVLLGKRLEHAGYTGISVGEDILQAWRGETEVFIHVWEQGAMSVVFADRSDKGLHLNYWNFRGAELADPLSALWAKFWADEQENKKLEWVLWMHGPKLLPPPGEEVPDAPGGGADVFALFSESVFPPVRVLEDSLGEELKEVVRD